MGAANAAIDVVVFNAAVLAHPTRSAQLLVGYNTLAVVAALANSYWCNSRWTFRGALDGAGHRRRRQRGLFIAQAGINLLVYDVSVWLLGRLLLPRMGLPTAIASNLAKVAAMIVASTVSYLLMALVVFPRAPSVRVTE